MSTTAAELSNLLPAATQAREKLALAEAEKATEALRRNEKAHAEKKALIDQLSKPSGGDGLTEVAVLRFPNALCTDHGRAINNREPGWETTRGARCSDQERFGHQGFVMTSNASGVAAGGHINHVRIVVLALLASLIIMLIGITARATDDTNGYGVVSREHRGDPGSRQRVDALTPAPPGFGGGFCPASRPQACLGINFPQ